MSLFYWRFKLNEVRVCYRCKRKVYPTKLKDYSYQCFVHDEDLFEIETIAMDEEDYLELVSKRLHCSKKEAKHIQSEYDSYVYSCIANDNYPISIEKFAKTRLNQREVRR